MAFRLWKCFFLILQVRILVAGASQECRVESHPPIGFCNLRLHGPPDLLLGHLILKWWPIAQCLFFWFVLHRKTHCSFFNPSHYSYSHSSCQDRLHRWHIRVKHYVFHNVFCYVQHPVLHIMCAHYEKHNVFCIFWRITKNITKNITKTNFIYGRITKNIMFFNNVYLQNSLRKSW